MSYAITTKVCDHLSLGVCHCTSTTTTTGEAKAIDSSTNKMKLVEQTDGATKKKTCNDDLEDHESVEKE
ncbi:hypothetical protein A2U01_0017700 [Trifolium medium]|uniref:Uncharacterized protein n=1 Tax=Trifolium medium TaxID=97028 RepID=A0A392NB48_9FABA|nr:hypothetical protein [Trifolium medium]